MEHRFLGDSGFKVPVLGLGTGTFGGKGPLFSAWGGTDADEARRLVDICLEAGVNLFDSADVYSDGASEFILGAAIKGRRDDVLLSTKVSIRAGQGPNDVGARNEEQLRDNRRTRTIRTGTASSPSATRRLSRCAKRLSHPKHAFAHRVRRSAAARRIPPDGVRPQPRAYPADDGGVGCAIPRRNSRRVLGP
jgi:aryl-alcohol dehydrogenase-like predicted oxidoreductase